MISNVFATFDINFYQLYKYTLSFIFVVIRANKRFESNNISQKECARKMFRTEKHYH